ncbi:M23 family metallopeptidase [Candidatus Hepatincolaceae symbiont of Richtersius coronifer]
MVTLYLKNNIFLIVIFTLVLWGGVDYSSINAASGLQQHIISLSERIRENEIELNNLTSYRELLQLKQINNQNKINNYAWQINNRVVSIYKMSNTPLQSLFVTQLSPKETAITYALLNYTTKHLKSEIAKSQQYLQLQATNDKELAVIKKKITNINKQLNSNIILLNNYLKDNPSAQELSYSIKQIQNKNSQLMGTSKSLQQLIYTLTNDSLLLEDINKDKDFLANKGSLIWPVAGFINKKYNEDKQKNIYYNGISILATPNSQIVAPHSGEIMFANYFPNFENLIIIKHSASYYTIISGKYKSFVRETQLVKKHEPIAISQETITPIYFEIQYKNTPQNPLPWLLKIK